MSQQHKCEQFPCWLKAVTGDVPGASSRWGDWQLLSPLLGAQQDSTSSSAPQQKQESILHRANIPLLHFSPGCYEEEKGRKQTNKQTSKTKKPTQKKPQTKKTPKQQTKNQPKKTPHQTPKSSKSFLCFPQGRVCSCLCSMLLIYLHKGLPKVTGLLIPEIQMLPDSSLWPPDCSTGWCDTTKQKHQHGGGATCCHITELHIFALAITFSASCAIFWHDFGQSSSSLC